MQIRVPDLSNQLKGVGVLSDLNPSQWAAKSLRDAADSLTDSGKPKPPTFRGANLGIQSYRGREWMLSGPRDTGKTFAGLWLLDSLLRQWPGAKVSLARKIQSTIYNTVLITWENVIKWKAALGMTPPEVIGGTKPQMYTYSNGSRLWCGGMDNPQKILSGERDFIYMNQAEELTLEDWELLFGSCTGRGAVTDTPMLMGDCNPGPEDHWILKRPTLKVFYAQHKDNPSLYNEDGTFTKNGEGRVRDLQSLTGIRKKRLYEGQWVGAEGLFFEEFDPETGGLHVCEPFSIAEDAPIWGSLDHGYKHPTAFYLFTENEDGVFVIGEHVQAKLAINLHCLSIRRLLTKLKIDHSRLKVIYAGHDVFQERGADADVKKFSDQYLNAINPTDDDVTSLPAGAKIGFKLERANVARPMGAQEILRRLGNAEMSIAPTLKLFNTCGRLIRCLSRMVTDPHNAEDVLKVNADAHTGEGGDDEYDAFRYGLTAKLRTKVSIMKW